MKMGSNKAAALDRGSPVLLTIVAHWPAASEPRCYCLWASKYKSPFGGVYW
jgi:hypothetical protein